ncbi:serine/threonine-protein kinase [Phytohabitans flavus]|uniref:serine/threonine-protein kinase n=1 Tax=Phytohabitans flavus TaxID=1076124 RepID=UPI0015640EE1
MLRSGVSLDDRYRLDERVATGGMGDVWRATDLTLGRTVAVKVLLPSLSADPGFGARFLAESRMLAAVRHPGVVQVYDRGECELPEGGRATYLVMEFVDGEPLSARISREERLPPAVAMRIVAEAAQALDAVHEGGIVHRDVKPSNLMLRPDGRVVLLDFGVARSAAVTSVTGTNAGVLGTALYMAPEQARRQPVTPATDVYALGAVAYHAIAGHPPFMGDNPVAVAMMHLDTPPPELPADVPPAVRAVVLRALEKEPADRYATGAALASAALSAVGAAPLDSTAELPDDPDATAPVGFAGNGRINGVGRAGVPVAPPPHSGRPVRCRPYTPAAVATGAGTRPSRECSSASRRWRLSRSWSSCRRAATRHRRAASTRPRRPPPPGPRTARRRRSSRIARATPVSRRRVMLLLPRVRPASRSRARRRRPRRPASRPRRTSRSPALAKVASPRSPPRTAHRRPTRRAHPGRRADVAARRDPATHAGVIASRASWPPRPSALSSAPTPPPLRRRLGRRAGGDACPIPSSARLWLPSPRSPCSASAPPCGGARRSSRQGCSTM